METVAAFSASAFPGLSYILDDQICSIGGVMCGEKHITLAVSWIQIDLQIMSWLRDQTFKISYKWFFSSFQQSNTSYYLDNMDNITSRKMF